MNRSLIAASALAVFLGSAGFAMASLPNCYPSTLPRAGHLRGDQPIPFPVSRQYCPSGQAWVIPGKNTKDGQVLRERKCGCS